MVNYQSNRIKKSGKLLYPVGGYTKRIDQYGAVPPSVLAEERRLQQLESRIEKGRRWQLAQCKRNQREAARHLKELNEAKGKTWLPAVGHTEYLYGGCLAVRVAAGDCVQQSEDGRDAFTCNNHRRPPGRACHRTQAKTDLPQLLTNCRLERRPRSWATLKKQFKEKVFRAGGEQFPRIQDTGHPVGSRSGRGVDGCDGASGIGGDFVDEMKNCRYLRVPARYRGRGDE